MKRSSLRRYTPLRRVALARKTRRNRNVEFSPTVRQQARERAGFRCERCGEYPRTEHLHHRLPRAQGGLRTLENAVLLCDPCHRYVHEHPAESYECGWLLHAWDVAS